jgi:hypothetical protein
LRQILEKKWEYNGTVHQLFIDFKKAYDSVRREKLYNILIQFGIPKKLVQLVKVCLSDPTSKVRIGNIISDSFGIRSGLKQGDALSPLLFNFALEYAIQKVKKYKKGLKLNGLNQLFVYADDVDLLGDDIHELQSNTDTLVAACSEIGLQVNVEKTKYMITSRNAEEEGNRNITINNMTIEKVNKFKYLGAYITSRNEVAEEIKSRLVSGNACFFSVQKLLASRLISRKLKLKLYRTVILPVILYGCESWSTTLADEHKLRVFENKVLRKIYGPKRDEITGEWRRLHNEELHELYDSPDIIRIMKSRRLRWAGHVARMGEKRRLYSIVVGKPEGKRPLGRPRRRWEDNIRRDLREVGVRDENWLVLAQDRTQWRTFVTAAMNLRVP